MAFPDLPAPPTSTSQAGIQTFSVTLPVVNSGDLLLMGISKFGTANIVTPTGWTEEAQGDIGVVGRYAVFSRTSDGNDGTQQDVDLGETTNAAAQVYWSTNWDFFEVSTVETNSSNVPNPEPLETTWTALDTTWLAWAFTADDDAGFSSPPSNYGDLFFEDSGGGLGSGASIGSAHRELNAYNEDPGSFLIDTSQDWAALTIGIRLADTYSGNGSGTSGDKYQVTTMAQLHEMRNFPNSEFELLNDLDAGAETDNSGGTYWNGGDGWRPIGNRYYSWKGVFNGGFFEIDGLQIQRVVKSRFGAGLFGSLQDADVSRVGLPNATIEGDTRVGALFGDENSASGGSTIALCYATGSVNSNTAYIGGLWGVFRGTADDCYANAAISQNNDNGAMGGLGGYSTGTQNRCYAAGAITAGAASNINGLIGQDLSTSNDCFWDTEATGVATDGGGGATGKTTAEMQDVATFTDTATAGLTSPWDFVGNPNDDVANNDYWNINTNEYPHLTDFAAAVIAGVVQKGGSAVQDALVAIFTIDDFADSITLTFVEFATTDANGDFEMSAAHDTTKHYIWFPIYFDVDYSGTADSGSNNGLSDSDGGWTSTEFDNGDYIVRITGNTGSGQERVITGSTTTSITVSPDWGVNPDGTSTYEIGRINGKTFKTKLRTG